MKGKRGSFFSSFLLVLFIFSSLWGGEFKKKIQLEYKRDKNHILTGSFEVDVSSAVVWDVLTDYDQHRYFIESIHLSKRKNENGRVYQLEQDFFARILFFGRKMRVLLDVEETPFEKISFVDTAKEDFRFYQGYWLLTSIDNRTKVTYHLKARPIVPIPQFFLKGPSQKLVKKLLRQVAFEIIRRSQPKESSEENQ